MKCKYCIQKESIAVENGKIHTVYGIELWQDGKLVKTTHNVFCDKATAEHYITLFNKNKLSPMHLEDIIEEII